MVGDPAQIRAVAARLRDHAMQLRQVARRVGQTRDLAWQSPAADLFRRRVGERVHSLWRSAVELERAARRVEVHADAVEAAMAEAARLTAVATELATTAGGAVTHAGEVVARGAEAVTRGVGRP